MAPESNLPALGRLKNHSRPCRDISTGSRKGASQCPGDVPLAGLDSAVVMPREQQWIALAINDCAVARWRGCPLR